MWLLGAIPQWINRPRPLIFLFAMLLVGCAAEPFQRPPLPILHDPNPSAIREQFPQLLPDEFTSDDTLIFQFPFVGDVVTLGVLNVNRPAGTFELYSLNQTGITYFHLSGDRKFVYVREAMGPWMEHKDILLSIAQDIQRIYLNPAPSLDSKINIRADRVDFSLKTSGGRLVYQFGMEPAVLLQKELNGCFGASWRARYYDYRPGTAGKLFPHGIVMDNYQSHYRLIIKNRDWTVGENQ
jgi:hypothetical protein